MFYQLNYGHQNGRPAQPNGSGFILHSERDVTSSERKSESSLGSGRHESENRARRNAGLPFVRVFSRGVAQPGSAPALGAGCRGFKSRLPDPREVFYHFEVRARSSVG